VGMGLADRWARAGGVRAVAQAAHASIIERKRRARAGHVRSRQASRRSRWASPQAGPAGGQAREAVGLKLLADCGCAVVYIHVYTYIRPLHGGA
jgi:hypothetical protein